MATIGAVMARDESDAFMDRIEQRFDRHGFGLWCVDLDGEPIGFTGLAVPWFRDGVEIGWRIRSPYWGRGTRPKRHGVPVGGVRAAELSEVISFTAAINANSRRVTGRDRVERARAVDDRVGELEPAEGDAHPQCAGTAASRAPSTTGPSTHTRT